MGSRPSLGTRGQRTLNIPEGSPVLKVERFLYAEDGCPVGIGIFFYHGERYSLVDNQR